jgi:hypothetical protein
MDAGSISAVSGYQQYQAPGEAITRRDSGMSAVPNAVQANIGGSDTVEISQAAKDAYAQSQNGNTPELQRAILDLTRIQNEVLAHEQAHMSVGGSLAGAASYTYTTGPDGKRYITGGEVPISMPTTDDKEKMLTELERVKKAALAPAKPSSQDQSVAAEASAKAAKLRAEIASENIKKMQQA